MEELFLDNASTTPLLKEVKQKIIDSLDIFGNPSTSYNVGRKAKQMIEEARNEVAKFIKDEAYEQLQNCDISDYKNFLPHNVKMIDEILGNATTIKETKSTKSESLEENDKEEVKETIDKEDTVVKKTNTKKKYSK